MSSTENNKPTGNQPAEEQKKPATTQTTETKPGEKPAETEKSFMERIEGVLKDLVDTKFAAFEKQLDVKIADLLKAKEIEVEHALRKGMGLEQDPVVHASDLIAELRKRGLEKSESGKRTPGKEEPGPEGSEKPDAIDEKFAKAFS